MTKRLLVATLALTVGFSSLAQAQLDNAAPGAAAQAAKPPGYRSATYSGGEGATWKTGPNTHGFTGTYGGCRYSGFAGPKGYKIDRVC